MTLETITIPQAETAALALVLQLVQEGNSEIAERWANELATVVAFDEITDGVLDDVVDPIGAPFELGAIEWPHPN